MISTKGRYALRLMIDIANNSNNGEECVSLKDISIRQDISIKYLEQVVSLLVKSGLLVSIRGINGGYKLVKKAEEYSVGEILRAGEGTLAPVACLECPVNTCKRQEFCSTIKFWKEFDNLVSDFVDNKTLQDLINQNK